MRGFRSSVSRHRPIVTGAAAHITSMEPARLTRHQLDALRQAQIDEGHGRAILETLDQITDPDEHRSAGAHAQRLLDDALQVRETVRFVDPWIHSPSAAQRICCALNPQATLHTWNWLDDDREASVREAVVLGRAAREARFPPPGSAGEYLLEPVDPMSLIGNWVGGASSLRGDAD